MKNPLQQLGRFAAIVALGSTLAMAAETGFDTQLKLRVGYSLQNKKEDHLTQRVLGFGLDFGYTTSFGRFGLEAGYQYKPGDQYQYDAVNGSIPSPDATVVINPAQTADLRRNSFQGLTVRASYEYALDDAWALRGGIQFGGARFKHEYVGQVGGTRNGAAFTDAYQATPTNSPSAGHLFSPFIGFSYKITESSSVEVHVIGIDYQAANYVHVAGTATGAADRTAQGALVLTDRRVPHLEVGYVFHF